MRLKFDYVVVELVRSLDLSQTDFFWGVPFTFSNHENHPIYDVCFSTGAGYNTAVYRTINTIGSTEIRPLFSRAGFIILEYSLGCPSF